MPPAVRALKRLAVSATIVAALVAGAGIDRAATTECARFSIESLTVGSPLGYVRTRFGREPTTTNLAQPGRPDTTAVDYVVRGRAIYVEYDHRIDRKPAAKVAVLRASLPSTEEALQETVRRLGTPTVSPERKPDEDGNLPAPDGFVWVDPACGIVATVYRRSGSWWSGDVGTFLQIESIDTVQQGTSAALPYLGGTAALATLVPPATDPAASPPAARADDVATSAPTPADGKAAELTAQTATDVPAVPPVETLETAAPQDPVPTFAPVFDTVPRRIAASPPIYPANLRLMGVTGRVSVVAVVRIDGTVGDVRVVKAEPAGRGFEQAAVAGVKRWRYKPATLRGVPMESEVEIVVDFK